MYSNAPIDCWFIIKDVARIILNGRMTAAEVCGKLLIIASLLLLLPLVFCCILHMYILAYTVQ